MQLFPTKYDKILEKVDLIQTIKYASTRNHKNGNVSKLSPYISRGVISTRFIYEKLVERGINLKKCEKFIQELAWRDFWQQIWVSKGSLINKDLKRPQEDVNDFKISKSLVEAKTGINSVDKEIAAYLLKKSNKLFNIAGKLSLNEWRGKSNVEFIIDDISVNKNVKNMVPSSIG